MCCEAFCPENYSGVVRTTYLLDEEGIIRWCSDRVKAGENPAQMLTLLDA